jgi:hypothetical protein
MNKFHDNVACIIVIHNLFVLSYHLVAFSIRIIRKKEGFKRESSPESMNEYRIQLQKGSTQKDNNGLVDYIMTFRTYLKNRYPDYFCQEIIFLERKNRFVLRVFTYVPKFNLN